MQNLLTDEIVGRSIAKLSDLHVTLVTLICRSELYEFEGQWHRDSLGEFYYIHVDALIQPKETYPMRADEMPGQGVRRAIYRSDDLPWPDLSPESLRQFEASVRRHAAEHYAELSHLTKRPIHFKLPMPANEQAA